MPISSISDLQMSLIGRRQNANLRTELVRLTQEIASGQVSDIQKEISGDTAPLSSIERNLSLLDGYEFAARRAELKLTYAATALEKVQSNVTGLGSELLTARQSGVNSLQPVLSSAEGNFASAVSALKAQVGNQFVFSGLNSQQSPLIEAEAILDLVRLEVSGVTEPAAFLDVVDRWFTEPGNGFETDAYRGGAQSTVGLAVSSTDVIDDIYTADNDTIRSTLRDLAVIALVAEGSYAGNTEAVDQVIESVSASLLSSDDQITLSSAGDSRI